MNRMALHASIMAMHKRLCKNNAPVISKVCHRRLLNEHVAATRHVGVPAAVRFYLILAYSFSGKFGSWATKPSFRLLHVLPSNISVHLADAMKVLRSVVDDRDSSVCMYLDPPYYSLPDSGSYFTLSAQDIDHAGLAGLLHNASKLGVPWVLSYNDSPQVRRLYKSSL